VKLDHIPSYFKFIYYGSVPALTQRALIVNDFLCCYLTATCEDGVNTVSGIIPSLNQTNQQNVAFCPNELQSVADGSDKGNLGRFALKVLGMDSVDNYLELFTIFCAALGCRIFAAIVFYIRERISRRLKEINRDSCWKKLELLRPNQTTSQVTEEMYESTTLINEI